MLNHLPVKWISGEAVMAEDDPELECLSLIFAKLGLFMDPVKRVKVINLEDSSVD